MINSESPQIFEQNRDEMTKAILKSTTGGQDNFLSWFNRAASLEESVIRGAWDFSFYFASPEVCRYMEKPEEKTCLEIGYGGGRLLNASRNFFKFSHGIDVHPYNEQVRDLLLQQRPEEDFTLHNLSSNVLPFPDASIDYAYSFIVIQHFYSHQIFETYLDELQRIIAPGGLVNLYFADLWRYPGKCNRNWFKSLFGGVLEESAPPDEHTAYNTLWMTSRHVRSLLKRKCFFPLSVRKSFKRIPDGYPDINGQQSGILAIRN